MALQFFVGRKREQVGVLYIDDAADIAARYLVKPQRFLFDAATRRRIYNRFIISIIDL